VFGFWSGGKWNIRRKTNGTTVHAFLSIRWVNGVYGGAEWVVVMGTIVALKSGPNAAAVE